jgi:oligopeptidase A
MLTRVDYPAVAGINGVAWDAVELPSQFMENYCWEREALDLFAGHHVDRRGPSRTTCSNACGGEELPVRDDDGAPARVRPVRFPHAPGIRPGRGGRIYEILEEVREQVAVVKPPAWNRFAHGFSHIFGGGYAAGYYSYKWAEVLSADAFSLFEETRRLQPGPGRAFLRTSWSAAAPTTR